MKMQTVFQALLDFGHDEDFKPTLCKRFRPTAAGPGSPEKLDVLADRVANGWPLWHPEDEKMCSVPSTIRGRSRMESGGSTSSLYRARRKRLTE
jgi:hypothetical protein